MCHYIIMDFITEKHLSKIKKNTQKTNKCWLWTGYKDKDGYAIMNMKGINRKVHRVVYFINFGDIPEKMFVCHKCDNPSCINPKHLFLGTPNDNVQDMMKKGRFVSGGKPHPGEKNGRAILTEKQVREIYKQYKILTYEQLSKKYSVGKSCIQNIMLRRSWKHLTLIR